MIRKTTQVVLMLAMVAGSQFASADAITAVTLDIGGGGTTTFTNGVTDDGADFTATQLILQEFTAGGVTYNQFVGADGWVQGNGAAGDVEGILYAPGGTPGTVGDIYGDLNLSTGSLDPYGDGLAATAEEYFSFASQTISSDSVFFLFANGTGTNDVALVDSTGVDISNALSYTGDLGGEVQLSDVFWSRTNGGDLANREVFGNVFAVSEFTLTGANTVADIAGFRGSGIAFDAQDAGIASSAVPEPSSALVLLCGVGACVARRRRR